MRGAPRVTTTIVSRIFAPEPGAAPLRLHALAEALVRAGERVMVVTASLPRSQEDTFASEGVKVSRAWVKRNRDGYVRGYLSYFSFDAPALLRLLFGPRCDGYVVEPPPTTGAVVRVVAALRRVPYVYYAGDVLSDAVAGVSSAMVTRLVRALERWAMNGAALVLTVSPEVAQRVRALEVDSPIQVTGFGVDTGVFRYRVSAAPQTATFVYAGMFSERHGAEVFASALGMVLDERPGSARLEFYGTGTDAELIREACPERHRGSITFHSQVPADRIAEILCGATAGLASVKPGHGYDYAFATKALAAMATGCPVIYTGPGPAGMAVDEASQVHSACLAVPYDVAAVAAAMRQVLDQPRREPERERLARWVHERYAARVIADAAATRILDSRGDATR